MSGEIIVSDALEKLKDEIRILKATLAELLQERDDLIYHIGPELCARYAAEIGDYQNRANYQELMILELKRRIEIAQAALNREQSISEEEVDKRIEKEYQEFHQKVDEEYQKSKKFKEEQAQKEEKRKHYEEQWKKQYSQREEEESTEKKSDTDNSSEDNDIKSKEKPLPNAKELYRKIVKKLHPDMNPNATEYDLELFHRATKAYNNKEEMDAKKEDREPLLLPDFSAHHLRHTFCTRLCENETNLKVIMSIMGHADISTTMDIYAEVTDQKKQESFNNLSRLDIF